MNTRGGPTVSDHPKFTKFPPNPAKASRLPRLQRLEW